jgi:hypothetical protein
MRGKSGFLHLRSMAIEAVECLFLHFSGIKGGLQHALMSEISTSFFLIIFQRGPLGPLGLRPLRMSSSSMRVFIYDTHFLLAADMLPAVETGFL